MLVAVCLPVCCLDLVSWLQSQEKNKPYKKFILYVIKLPKLTASWGTSFWLSEYLFLDGKTPYVMSSISTRKKSFEGLERVLLKSKATCQCLKPCV